jgi:polo-like kinase 1
MMTGAGLQQKQNLELLHQQLTELFAQKLKRHLGNLGDENSDPASNPLFWISKWVDYSDKYGFGYQLCDEGMGVMFNDTTKVIMLANGM